MGSDPPDDERPAYQRVASALREEIRNGRLKPGDRVPSVRQLAQDQRVASMTAQNALRLLHREGLIVISPGRGTFVRSAAPSHDSDDELAALTKRVENLEREVHELKRTKEPPAIDQS